MADLIKLTADKALKLDKDERVSFKEQKLGVCGECKYSEESRGQLFCGLAVKVYTKNTDFDIGGYGMADSDRMNLEKTGEYVWKKIVAYSDTCGKQEMKA